MAVQKTHAVKILISVLCFVLIFAFPLSASAAVGVGTWWDGVVSILHSNADFYLNYSHEYAYYADGDKTFPSYVKAVYKGNANAIIDVSMYDTDVYLNGYIRKRLNFVCGNPSSNGSVLYLNVNAEPIILDDIFISVQNVSRDFGGVTAVDVYIQFDNYYVDSDTLRLPLYFDCTVDANFNTWNSQTVDSIIPCNISEVEDWYGDMWQYDNLEEVPSLDGYFAEQNQTMIDQSQTQIQNQEIQNQLQEQQNQLQNQGNQLQQESNQQNKNFMDNFFGNLGNTVLGWIVPSSEDLTGFLDEVNSWFSDRLGFVWYPFDLAFQLVSAFGQGQANSMFKVPGFTMNFQGQQLQIWQPLEVDIDAFDIFKYVRYFTSALLACGVAHLAINKWDEWIGGHNS